jgi:hypothetical protein
VLPLETIRPRLHSPKALPVLVIAWYALLLSVGIAILQGVRKD